MRGLWQLEGMRGMEQEGDLETLSEGTVIIGYTQGGALIAWKRGKSEIKRVDGEVACVVTWGMRSVMYISEVAS